MRELSVGLVCAVMVGCAGQRIRPPRVEAPPDSIPVEVLSADPYREWNVIVGRERVCVSPCKGFAKLDQPILLQSGDDQIVLPRGVTQYRDLGPIRLRPVGFERAPHVTGIVFTSLGGMAVFTGGFLALAGWLGAEEGLFNAGTITGGAGAAVTVAGLFLLYSALPHAEVYAFDGPEAVRLSFGPTTVKAEF